MTTENTRKKIQVSATVEPELHAELTELRWELKADKFSDIVVLALTELAAKHRAPEPEKPASEPEETVKESGKGSTPKA